MIDYFPKLSNQALSIFAKTLSEDKLQKPFLRLLPKDHVKLFIPTKTNHNTKSFFIVERKSFIKKWFSPMFRIYRTGFR